MVSTNLFWGWWFPRQLSLQEFRVGCLEYEFVELEEKMISIHIPSVANLEEKQYKNH